MDYQATLRYLEAVQSLGIKLGLENMTRLLKDLGEPERAFPAVVVAGTNGKGSVCAFLASILQRAGHRVGLYTSPHLVRYEERIAVDGAPVTGEQLAGAITVVKDHVDSLLARGALASHPTHFEVLTAAAFHHFRERAIDVGVLEVGMGGRLDAVAPASTAVAVITNVSMEHSRYLGDTVKAIAAEKAGIIRQGCYVVTSESAPEVLEVLRHEARRRGARLIEMHREAQVSAPRRGSSGSFSLTTRTGRYDALTVPLLGRHQIQNAAAAVLAGEALCQTGFRESGIPAGVVAEGLARARWPGRLQIVERDPLFLLDGAHNPAGCTALARALVDLRDSGAFRKLCLIFGVLQDKEMESMARRLFPLAARVVVTRGRSERFRDPEGVASIARALGFEPVVTRDVGSAIGEARSRSDPGDAICLCGSLYLVGDALEALGLEPFVRETAGPATRLRAPSPPRHRRGSGS